MMNARDAKRRLGLGLGLGLGFVLGLGKGLGDVPGMVVGQAGANNVTGLNDPAKGAGGAWVAVGASAASVTTTEEATREGTHMPPEGGTPSQVRPGDRRAAVVTPTKAIRGSLFGAGVTDSTAGYAGADGEVRGPRVSLIAVDAPKPKRYRKNDVLTIVVREDSDSISNGQASSKKTQDYDLALQQWIQAGLDMNGLPKLSVVGESGKLPEIKFKYANNRQSDASAERSDSFSARIEAVVVDVKPNGTMVVEAQKQIVVDREVQVFKLSGLCRVEDIAVDNSILSTQLANLSVSKKTNGTVRDGTDRGWLNEIIDALNPF
jgi:flagellar L-ring protein FlgH